MPLKSRWPDAHVNLRRLYEERVQDMTQAQFGKKYDIGTQPMVWQYLNGHRPVNYEAAAKFARGLRCTIYDISPEMADSIKDDILPYLGRALRRAAVLACFAIAPLTAPAPADAAVFGSSRPPTVYYVKWMARLRRWGQALAILLGFAAAAACTTIDEHTPAPKDWPNLSIHEHRVAHSIMRDACVPYTGFWSYPEACSIVNFETLRCDIWLSADFPLLPGTLEHERAHCAGHDHVGDTTLADAWKLFKASTAGRSVSESAESVR